MPGPTFVRPSTHRARGIASTGGGRRASGEGARGHQHALRPGAAFLGREVSIAEQRVHSGVAALGFRQRQPVDQRRRQRRLIRIALERGGSLRRRRLARAERGVERRVDLDVARVVGDAFREHVHGSVDSPEVQQRHAEIPCERGRPRGTRPRLGSNPRWPHRTARRTGAARRAGTSPGHRRDWPRAPRAAPHNCCAGSETRRSAAGARPPGSRRCPNRPSSGGRTRDSTRGVDCRLARRPRAPTRAAATAGYARVSRSSAASRSPSARYWSTRSSTRWESAPRSRHRRASTAPSRTAS